MLLHNHKGFWYYFMYSGVGSFLLFTDATNAETLLQIESSIFILCLDVIAGESQPHDDTFIALHMLHGHGSHLNSCNRWYDKTMQVPASISIVKYYSLLIPSLYLCFQYRLI